MTTTLQKLQGSKAHTPKKSKRSDVACVPHAIAAVTGHSPEEVRQMLQERRATGVIPRLTKSKQIGYWKNEYIPMLKEQDWEVTKLKVNDGETLPILLNEYWLDHGDYLVVTNDHVMAMASRENGVFFFDNQMGRWHKLEDRRKVETAHSYNRAKIKNLYLIEAPGSEEFFDEDEDYIEITMDDLADAVDEGEDYGVSLDDIANA